MTFNSMIHDAARFLEHKKRCAKHHVAHTGSHAYLLDFYTELGDIEKGRHHMDDLLGRIVVDNGNHVFYPGHLDPMNMSQNVIDTGASVDAISRFLTLHHDAFTQDEHTHYASVLGEVVDGYLVKAAGEKIITNQRLWGLTGVASFAHYIKTDTYNEVIKKSIEQAFSNMTEDGFFRYYPDPKRRGDFEGYDGMTPFYQSRHIAFTRYALSLAHIDTAPYEERLIQSERALLSMYKTDGIKDMRMESKRWYWQSSYEVASSGFDAYALAHSSLPEAQVALNNLLFQARQHFFDGYLHSAFGPDINFQCPIFWTAHLAWLLRIPDAQNVFNSAHLIKPFSFRFVGHDVVTATTPAGRVLLNSTLGVRNPSVGMFDNGLPDSVVWVWQLPKLPPRLIFSARETINHIWYALRGGHFLEALLRSAHFLKELFVMLLPRYSTRYGEIKKVERVSTENREVFNVTVVPASKYGTLLDIPQLVHIAVPSS